MDENAGIIFQYLVPHQDIVLSCVVVPSRA